MKKVFIIFGLLALVTLISCTSQNEQDKESESLYQDGEPVQFGVDRTKIEKPGSQNGG
jgi:ABC-type phosphate/phosphonate transport system substrate-binding protein